MDIRLKYGLFTGVASGIWYVLFYEFLFTAAPFLSFLAWFILIAGIFLGVRQAKFHKYGNQITFSQGISSGMLITIFAGLISTITNIVYIKIINPGFISKYIKEVEKMMINHQVSAEEIKTQLNVIEKSFSIKIMLASGLTTTFLVGLVISVITAVILRNKDMGVIP